jgi:hypothetical protein
MSTEQITLFNDPFFLHSALEEMISSNIGNNFFTSFDSFKKYLPEKHKNLLNDSTNYISEYLKLIQARNENVKGDIYDSIINKNIANNHVRNNS